MITDHLRSVMDRLATLPDDVQDEYATQLEVDLQERERIAAQLADPNATDIDYLLARADEQSAEGKVYDLDSIL